MGCDRPMKGWRPRDFTGPLTFNRSQALNADNPITVPCGKCTGCRLDKSREWAIRATHEASLYERNCFVTLTFSNEHLPPDYSVSKRDLQLFMKRLRKSVPHLIRFYGCGEYGDQNYRPHYHALLFNHDFNQKTVYSIKNNNKIYTSPELSSLWPFGLSTIGSVTYKSAAYCARYSMKKIGGEMAEAHYTRVHPLTGKVNIVNPEFALMSTKPGIGQGWFDRFASDVFPGDFIVLNGVKHPVPRFYSRKLQEEEAELIKRDRKFRSLPYKEHFKPDRLRARAEVREARMSTVKRNL